MLMDVLDLFDWKRRIFELYAESPGVSQVELTSDELVSVCPITGQPDLYVASIEYTRRVHTFDPPCKADSASSAEFANPTGDARLRWACRRAP
jgi:hypothetical protein